MFKKFTCVLLLISSSLTFAETCPTISDIKAGQFHHWQPLDIDNAEPVEGQALEEFKQAVAKFAFVDWMPDAPEGSGQCFYYGVEPDSDYLGVYLAKPTLEPDRNKGNWFEASFDVMQCNESISNCQFLDR
jgi:hypothetical protein